MISLIKRDIISDYLVSTSQFNIPITSVKDGVFSFETIAIYRGIDDEGFSLCARCTTKEKSLENHELFIVEIFKRLNQ